MINPETLGQMVKQHQKELLAQAEKRGLVNSLKIRNHHKRQLTVFQAIQLLILNRY